MSTPKVTVPMPSSNYFLSLCLFIFFSVSLICFGNVTPETAGNEPENGTAGESTTVVLYNTGVALYVNSEMGAMANICMSMALSDFYAKYPTYATRLSLQIWDLLDTVADDVSSLADASFTMALGESSSLIMKASAHFSSLAKASVAILENMERNEVGLLYEDTEYGSAIIPYLRDALENMDIQISHKAAIPTSAQDFLILEELKVLVTTVQSKVFVVHMTTTLASRLFVLANKAGMMSQGCSWLVTDGLSNLVEAMDPTALDSMKGLIGVRPYVPKTKDLKNFKTRYKRLTSVKQSNEASELNLLGLWAYDTLWTLAMTAERIGAMNNSHFVKKEMVGKSTSADPRTILEEILSSGFRGISGDFNLVNGQLQPSVFEMFNLTDNQEGILGYWNLDEGISRYLTGSSRNKLKKFITPGDSNRRTIEELGIPTVGRKWKIGIPSKPGFKEFVNIKNKKIADKELPGFSIDVFESVWKALALPNNTAYEFVTVDGTYDELCCQVKAKKIDAAAGDISIVASRTNCVDFTLPYLDSGITMLIKVSHEEPTDMWIFLKPLSWDLWLTIISICIFIGIIVRVLERRQNTEFNGSRRKQLSAILMFPCLSVAIPQRDMVATNCSKLVLVLWILLAFVLMQSYTANLSSILTVNQLQPATPSLKELRKHYIGYQNESFVKGFLIDGLGLNETMLKPYSTVDDYQEALAKGPDNGGVAAIFDEIPYIKLFLAQYTNGYTIVGPTYRTDGLGFAFPIGSPMVANFSKAILNFTQGKYMSPLERKYFGKLSMDQDQTGQASSSSPSLSTRSFSGLFLIIGIVVLLALVVSENHILGRFIQRYIFGCMSHDVSGSTVRPASENEMTFNNNPHQETNNHENPNPDRNNNRNEPVEEVVLDVHLS